MAKIVAKYGNGINSGNRKDGEWWRNGGRGVMENISV